MLKMSDHPDRMNSRPGRQRRPLRGPCGGVLIAMAVLAGLCQQSTSFSLRPSGSSPRWRNSWVLSYCHHVVGRPTGAATILRAAATSDDGGAGGVATTTNQTLRLLLVDHYDSFTYNLVDLLAQLGGTSPEVVAWDALSLRENAGGKITDGYDGIVLSPGPGAPADYPASLRLVKAAAAANVPLLGVCLGHQMVGLAHGATVCRAPEPVHGRIWECRVVEDADGIAAAPTRRNDTNIQKDRAPPVFVSRLFRGIPRRFYATRYHSLQVMPPPTARGQTPSLQVTATTTPVRGDGGNGDYTGDGDSPVVMALESTVAPQFGVQFHPESIGSLAVGRALLRNFLDVCRDHKQRRSTEKILVKDDQVCPGASSWNSVSAVNNWTARALAVQKRQTGMKHNETVVYVARLENHTVHWTPEQVMRRLYSEEPFAYWLDSATAPVSVQSANAYSPSVKSSSLEDSVSILGASQERVEYWMRAERNESNQQTWINRRIVEYNERGSQKVTFGQDIFEYLSNEYPIYARTESVTLVDWDESNRHAYIESVYSEQDQPLPFGFRGGHIGYLGYECRFDTFRFLQEVEGSMEPESIGAMGATAPDPDIPTAAFLMARQSLVFHHATSTWYLVGVGRNQKEKMDTLEWMRQTKQLLNTRIGIDGNVKRNHFTERSLTSGLNFVPNRSRATYMRNFEKCIDCIASGESYELCLTNQLEALLPDRVRSSFELYEILRMRNPAPHAAYFYWNLQRSVTNSLGAFAICCSSPERFVSVKRKTDGEIVAETKPIKGTRARVLPLHDGRRSLEEEQADTQRARDLQASIKDRAENLMIVDLLRNDFSRVCEIGSVHVSKMMDIESYATVHQMVTTIRGRLNPNTTTAIDLLKACFPGGSMTGAPKIRTMELLNHLEEGVGRGPYSGCLGYISFNGCADMNIIIRTAVLTPNKTKGLKVSIGSGGAITALSANIDEYDEMLLKAFPVTEAVTEWAASKERDAVLPIRSYNFTSNRSHAI